MTKMLSMFMILFAALSIGGGRYAAAQTPDLSRYQWKNRLLFLFAPSRSHPMFDALHQSIVVQAAEVFDRDLVVFEILDSGPSSASTAGIDSETAHMLRDRFNVNRGEFKVVLVGKDGGTKLNRKNQTHLKDIFDLIDAMPMRREEMRQKSK
jgi:hypothetical protein